MKNFKNEIMKANLIAIASYLVASFIIFVIMLIPGKEMVAFFSVIMAPLCGAILASPIIIREENKVRHFKRMMNKNKGL